MIVLNGFKIRLSSDTFHARVRTQLDAEKIHEYRKEHGKQWFFHWEAGQIYALHKTAAPDKVLSSKDAQTLPIVQHLPMLAARLVNALPDALPEYRPHEYRPFSWIINNNMMPKCLRGISGLPAILRRFSIRPRYELDARVIEMIEGERHICLLFNRYMRWEIGAMPSELEAAGVNTSGLVIVKRKREHGRRRLLGRIQCLTGSSIKLADAYDDLAEVNEEDIWIEGTLASFSQCLKPLLGDQYDRYVMNLEGVFNSYQSSDTVEAEISSMEQKLLDAFPIYLGGGLEAHFDGRLEPTNTPSYKSVVQSPPVEYCFDAGGTKRADISWRGLTRHGPFSRDTFPKKTPTVVVFFPDSIQRSVENYISLLRDGINLPGGKPSAYSGGFAQVWGLTNPKFVLRKIPWFGKTITNPALAYREAVESFLQEGPSADIAIVALLDEYSDLPDHLNPYLYAKAFLLMGGIPAQEIRLSKLRLPEKELQFINQDMTVAMYAKMSGTPWTVAHDRSVNDEIIIGMGQCDIQDSRFATKKRYIGITTVFYGDGTYLLSNLTRECPYEEYPDELRNSTLAVLRELKERNGWQPGDTIRIVFHIAKPLKNVEVADITARCVAELCGEQNIEFAFLTVTTDHPFLISDRDQLGITNYGRTKGKYVPARGMVVQVDTFHRLLATQGPQQIKTEKVGIPSPLLIKLHEQSTFQDQEAYRDLQALAEQVLRFTSMTWRSTRPAGIPVTILYSQEIAKLLVRLKNVEGWSPAVLRGRLKASRWFL